jgi:hypothetical protein
MKYKNNEDLTSNWRSGLGKAVAESSKGSMDSQTSQTGICGLFVKTEQQEPN